MLSKFSTLIDDAIAYFSRESNRDDLLYAQSAYGELVSPIKQDDDDYNRRMAGFYDWYLFDYYRNEGDKKHINLFLDMQGGDEELTIIADSVTLSLFEYLDSSWFKKNIYKDQLTGKKLMLVTDHRELLFLKEDILLGYHGTIGENVFFLDGVGSLERKAKKIILKEKKRVVKQQDENMLKSFLYQLELLDLRYRHYQHVGPEKIYLFDYAKN